MCSNYACQLEPSQKANEFRLLRITSCLLVARAFQVEYPHSSLTYKNLKLVPLAKLGWKRCVMLSLGHVQALCP